MNHNMKIVIGIPAYNEDKNIASIIVGLKKFYPDIIVCNDGSTDLTSEILKNFDVITINHKKNMGYGEAIKSIFLKSNEIDADILVTFDADGQHRIEDIQKVVDPLIKNESDLVIGSRFYETESNIPKYRKFGIKTITEITNIVGGTKIKDSQSGFRAYSKKILESIKPVDTGMGISTEILIKSHKLGLRISEVPIKILYEGNTSTHNPIIHGTSVILSTLRFVAIGRPLTFYGIPGIIFLVVGLIFGLWTVQIFSEQGKIVTNIALVGIGGVILGTILLITATILYSLVVIVKDKNST